MPSPCVVTPAPSCILLVCVLGVDDMHSCNANGTYCAAVSGVRFIYLPVPIPSPMLHVGPSTGVCVDEVSVSKRSGRAISDPLDPDVNSFCLAQLSVLAVNGDVRAWAVMPPRWFERGSGCAC
jgi:hypothetical protein